jgi:hypothetical protein
MEGRGYQRWFDNIEMGSGCNLNHLKMRSNIVIYKSNLRLINPESGFVVYYEYICCMNSLVA